MQTKKALFIVNPKAGARTIRRLAHCIEKTIDKNIMQYDLVFSEKRGDIKDIARQAAGSYDIIVAAGGDGTVNEAASALSGTGKVLGIIPTGSGNGLARELQIPLDPAGALRVINNLNERLIDAGLVNHVPFFCTAGMGFDSHIAKLFSKTTKRGFAGYLKIFTREFLHYSPQEYSIAVGDRVINTEAFAVTVANARQYGNNAFIAPKAAVNDGWLDLVIIAPFPKARAAELAFRLFSGSIDKSRYYQSFKIREAEITAGRADCFHMDGEHCIFTEKLRFSVKPKALRVLAPEVKFEGVKV